MHLLNELYIIARKLAKTNKYQTIYSQHKEAGTNLFKNCADYSAYQIVFLQYLAFYSGIFMDIYMSEVPEIVLDNEIYEDAYTHYKHHTKKIIKKKPQQPSTPVPKKSAQQTIDRTHVVFTMPKR